MVALIDPLDTSTEPSFGVLEIVQVIVSASGSTAKTFTGAATFSWALMLVSLAAGALLESSTWI